VLTPILYDVSKPPPGATGVPWYSEYEAPLLTLKSNHRELIIF
jgi:hypothetical protein